MMKFGNNMAVRETEKFLERMVSQSIEFDLSVRHRNEKVCPFTYMLLEFKNDNHFLKAEKLGAVLAALKQEVEAESKRVREFKEN